MLWARCLPSTPPGYRLSFSFSGLCFLNPGWGRGGGVPLPPLGGALSPGNPWAGQCRQSGAEACRLLGARSWQVRPGCGERTHPKLWGVVSCMGWGLLWAWGFVCQLASAARRWGPWAAGRDTPHPCLVPTGPAGVSGAGGSLPLLCRPITLRQEVCVLSALPTPCPGSTRTIPEPCQGLSLHSGLPAPNPKTLSPGPPREGPGRGHGLRPESTPRPRPRILGILEVAGEALSTGQNFAWEAAYNTPTGPRACRVAQEEGGGGAVSASRVSTEALSSVQVCRRGRDSAQPGAWGAVALSE